MPDLQKAFALRDNPFRLSNFLPGDMDDALRDQLETTPLRMAEDPRLLPLYSDDVYPAAVKTPWQTFTPFQDFQSRMRRLGYNDDPKAVDARKRPRIFLIRGPERTGKTTLAHRMMRWLLDCDPAGNAFHQTILRFEAPNAEAVTGLPNEIAKFGTGRKLVCLIEDVGAAAESELFKVFNNSTKQRTLFFFMTSSDFDVLKKDANGYQVQSPSVTAYETSTLNPSRAIKYCRHRMDLVRPDDPPAWLTRYPLFPFTDEIITSCVSSEGERSGRLWNEMGTIDIAQLNVKFADVLDAERMLPADFDIATVAEAEAAQHLLDPWPESGREQVA